MIFLILICVCYSLKDSFYLGSLKYSLYPQQVFEHQFFNIKAIKSMDLYYPEPPYRKVEDSFMECYWSYQQMGLQENQTLNYQLEDSFDSDLACFDKNCYIRQDNKLYSENLTIDLEQRNLKQLMVSTIGVIIYYNEKSIIVFDTIEKKIDNSQLEQEFSSALKHASDSILHINNNIIYTCSENGVQAYTHQFQLLMELTRSNEQIACKQVFLQDDTLFIISDFIYIFDINDPITPRFLLEIKTKADYYAIYNNLMALLLRQNENIFIKVFQYTLSIKQEELLNLTKISEGSIPNSFENKSLQFEFLNDEVVIVASEGTVNLISLKTTLHQKLRHNNSLIYSEHILSQNNKIFIYNNKLVQADNSLHFYTISNQIYNIVCTAPIQTSRFILYGLIRSEDKCAAQTSDEQIKFKQLIEQDKDKDVKCIYTFTMNIQVSVEHEQWSSWSLVLIGILIGIAIMFLIQFYNNNKNKQTLKNLRRFEQLNRLNLQKEKIRITHDDEDGQVI